MTIAAVSASHRPQHARPHFEKARRFMSVKIPKSIDHAWTWSEDHPRFFFAALFSVVAVAWAVRSSLGGMALTGVGAFVLGRSVGLVRAVAVKDKLADAERELVLARVHGDQAAADLAAVRADLAALTAASSRTQRMPAVGDGEVR